MLHIVIPVHNRLALTRRCLAALVGQSWQDFRVVLVDDGSTDGTAEAVTREFGGRLRLEIVRGSGSLFWGGASELGMREALKGCADQDHLMTLNNDTALGETFLETAMRLAGKYPGCQIGGISCREGRPGQVEISGTRLVCWPFAMTRRVWWPMSTDDLDRLTEEVADVDFLPGTAVVTPVGVVRQAGPVNGALLPHYHADSEFSYRIRRHGGRVLIARDLRIQHDLGATGIAGSDEARLRFRDFLRSFVSIRSGNCFKYKLRFMRACCPWWAWPTFLVCDTLKVVARGLALSLFGGQAARRLKSLVNFG